jgi:hypothetical protein
MTRTPRGVNSPSATSPSNSRASPRRIAREGLSVGGPDPSGRPTPPNSSETRSSLGFRRGWRRTSRPTTGTTRRHSASNTRGTTESMAEVNTPFHGKAATSVSHSVGSAARESAVKASMNCLRRGGFSPNTRWYPPSGSASPASRSARSIGSCRPARVAQLCPRKRKDGPTASRSSSSKSRRSTLDLRVRSQSRVRTTCWISHSRAQAR